MTQLDAARFMGLTPDEYWALPGAQKHVNPLIGGMSKAAVLVYYIHTKTYEAIIEEVSLDRNTRWH